MCKRGSTEKGELENDSGYLYILRVRDIHLPVCKIGRTSKNPSQRCDEINRSSTGDFIWEVAYEIRVNDCASFERLVHRKLKLFRQKRREFFNLTPESAFTAVQSILNEQSKFVEIDFELVSGKYPGEKASSTTQKEFRNTFTNDDVRYTELFAQFTKHTQCKGRPFGQTSRPHFGMSDGKEGVQWNIAVSRETNEIKLGVNLEGMKYRDWPIATFLLNELKASKLLEIRDQIVAPDRVFVQLSRDAWQVTARPKIVEQFIGPVRKPISEIDPPLWHSMVEEGLACLSKEKMYRARALQSVTLERHSEISDRKRIMPVSPHLTVWTLVTDTGDYSDSIADAIELLRPVYQWVSRYSQ